jgi:F-type H+-transporting ATPase subunit b
MLIDWFTVVAQIINFLILLALLKWLLFDRIVRAMDEREKTIAQRLEEAARNREQAEQQAADLEQERQQLASQRDRLLEEARRDADQQREELTSAARQEVDKLREDWRHTALDQQEEIVRQYNQHAADTLRQAVEQALRDLADMPLQEAAIRRFLHQLEQLDEPQWRQLTQHDGDATSRLVVTSASELPEEPRQQITQTLRRRLGDKATIAYETSADLLSGVEVRTRGHALGWNLRSYLEAFSEALAQALREETGANTAHEE